MIAIVKLVGKKPQIIDVENTLKELRNIVDGDIQTISLFNNIILICNDNGKLLNMQPNFSLGYDIIVGPTLFVSFDGKDDFIDLSKEQIESILRMFDT